MGFEDAGFSIGLAIDRNSDSIRSYNLNRKGRSRGFVDDVASLTPARLDELCGAPFNPAGVIGGPPCQSFSQANVNQSSDDARHRLPIAYANLLMKLNARSSVDFFVLENVVGLTQERHRRTFDAMKARFRKSGFAIEVAILNAKNFSTPQTRDRLFIVGFNRTTLPGLRWRPPQGSGSILTVRDAIGDLVEPAFFRRDLEEADIPHHPNHWCMNPKSPKFSKAGALTQGNRKGRSFKTLEWDRPSITVAYGHREVHIHPSGTRRLSVYEGMMLQGFPHSYRLSGTLSSQINQVSEAVPPPLARAVAESIEEQIAAYRSAADIPRVA